MKGYKLYPVALVKHRLRLLIAAHIFMAGPSAFGANLCGYMLITHAP